MDIGMDNITGGRNILLAPYLSQSNLELCQKDLFH